MTFLELVQWVSQEAQIPGNGPSAVTGQQGESRNLVNWVKAAWNEIETRHQTWFWRRKQFSFPTVADKVAYTVADIGLTADFSAWAPSSFRIKTTALPGNDALPLPPWTYEDWERYYLIASQAPGRPVVYSQRPNDQAIVLGPTPFSDQFTVAGWYYTIPQPLVNATDVPRMPAEFHTLIGYLALKKYARAEAAGEIYEDASKMVTSMMRRLENHQLPAIGLPDSLA
jgi:hypothetical protein